MEEWKTDLAASVNDPGDLPSYLIEDLDQMKEVVRSYPLRITPHYLNLLRNPGDPLWRQCMPDFRELSNDLPVDPLNEEGLSPIPGLIHRYPDRVVWLVSSDCAVYCRFCMRKGGIGCNGKMAAGFTSQLKAAIDYIAAHELVRDVVLSGGDPLLLDDEVLESILASLRSIPHLEIIRIGTRVPVTLPSRITTRLCSVLRRFQPIFINTHFNHPLEITVESSHACGMLADAGIPLANQTVLLRGVNDDPAVMKRLMQGLLVLRVRPYYIHHMDLVKGTGHFRTSVREGIRIMTALRGHTSGLANPHYMIDLPGGKGKVPVVPETVAWKERALLLTNYLGETVQYPDIE